MNFTDSPFEKMMKQKPHAHRPESTHKAKPGSLCYGCSFWQGAACVGTCCRDLKKPRKVAGTSGQVGPKSAL